MVLHNVPNDTEIIKITSTALRSKWFLERDQNRCHIVPVPCWAENLITEPNGHQILNHFLSQVVIYTVQLLLVEQLRQMGTQSVRALRIPSEGFLNDDPIPALQAHTGIADVNGYRFEHRRRQCQIEQTVRHFARFELANFLIQQLEVPSTVVATGVVKIQRPELLVLLLLIRFNLGNEDG